MTGTDTARKIAAAARRILEDEGPEAVSMRRIGTAVGITPMAIYHYFPDREALLNAITEGEFDRLAELLDSRRRRGSAKSQLLRVLDSYLDYAFQQPRIFDYMFSQQRKDARKFPGDFRARNSPTMNRLFEIVAEGMRKGEIRQDEVWEVALEVWAHIHGYLALFRAGRFALSEEDFRRLCRRSFRRLFDGLKA